MKRFLKVIISGECETGEQYVIVITLGEDASASGKFTVCSKKFERI